MDDNTNQQSPVTSVVTEGNTAAMIIDQSAGQPSRSTPAQILIQMQAWAAAILAEGVVLSSFKHPGLVGIEREEPVRRFLRNHLPGRFHVGQGSIASAETILPRQHDIIVADRDLCFMLLNTLNAQLLPVESVHLIVEVRSRLGELDDVATSLRGVRNLNATHGLLQRGALGSEIGVTPPPVHTIIIYQGPNHEKTVIEHMRRANEADSVTGRRLVIDFILVLAMDGDQTPASGYLVGYSRKDKETGHEFAHHIYPQVDEEGVEGPRVVWSGGDSFARWYAAILNHLAGVSVYPPNLYSYIGDQVSFLLWKKKPF